MKKLLSKITLLVVALALAFSLVACGNNEGDNKGNDDENKQSSVLTSQLLDDSVNAMLAKSGFAVHGEATINFNSELVKAIDMDFDAVFNKTDNDYNYKLVSKMGTEEMGNTVKVGNVEYYHSVYVDDSVTPAKKEEYWYTSFVDPISPEVIKKNIANYTSILKEVPNKAENGGYTISVSENYAPTIAEITNEVVTNKDKTLAEYLAAKFGNDSYTAEKLVEDVEAVLADNNTVAQAFAKVDAMITNMGVSNITVKSLINSAAQKADITAQDIYDMLAENMPSVPKPTAGQTVYDYVVTEQVFGAMKIDDLVTMITQGESDLEGLRATIVSILEEATVGAMWDQYVSDEDFDGSISEGLELLGVSQEVIADLTADGKAVLCAANLSKLTFNKLSLNVKVEFNGDKTLKAVNVNVALDVDYKANATAATVKLANIEVEGELTVKYSNVETVVVPTGMIKPILVGAYESIYISEFPDAFEYYAGSYTFKSAYYEKYVYDEETGNGDYQKITLAATGADGKITFTEEAIATLKTEVEGSWEVAINFEFEDAEHNIETKYIYVRPDSEE